MANDISLTPIVNPPRLRLRDQALIWADKELKRAPHSTFTLGALARACGKKVPSVHKAFGNHLEFLATLAAMQWERFETALRQSDGTPMGVALAAVAFAVDHANRFGLMYDPALWRGVDGEEETDVSSATRADGFALLKRARDNAFTQVEHAIAPVFGDLRVRLIASLVTGLSFEFAYERLFDGDRAKQLAHAEELIGMVLV